MIYKLYIINISIFCNLVLKCLNRFSKNVKIETSKKIPLKTKNAKNINFYTGNILEDSRTVDLGISESFILDLFMNI